MGRRIRGTGIALRPGSLLALALLVPGCGPLGPTPSPTPAPSATTRLPTPVPTTVAPTAPATAPVPSGLPGPAALLIRVTTCVDVCEPAPGTTILEDGRVIWRDAAGAVLEAQLSPEGLAAVRAEVDATPELEAGGDYQATLRPGAEPNPRGGTRHEFELVRDGRRILVSSGDPGDFEAEPDLWIVPDSVVRLAALAARLHDPVAWLGAAAMPDGVRPYAPAAYLVAIDLFPGIGDTPEFSIDVDDVEWPFGTPIESVGEAVPVIDDGFPVRCLVIDAAAARETADAEAARGSSRDLATWSSAAAYRWRRGQGFVEVRLQQLLPDAVDPCAALVVGPGPGDID